MLEQVPADIWLADNDSGCESVQDYRKKAFVYPGRLRSGESTIFLHPDVAVQHTLALPLTGPVIVDINPGSDLVYFGPLGPYQRSVGRSIA